MFYGQEIASRLFLGTAQYPSPAILAEAQELGASGADMLRAYVAGYEVWGELIFRERGNYQRKGWHPTGVFGALGAAAACAAL